MKNKNKIQEELKEIAPNLSMLERNNPFKVPSNYFQNMQAEVMESIQEPVRQKQTSWFDQLINKTAALLSPKPILAMATVAIGLFVFFNLETTKLSDSDFDFGGLTPEDLTAYVEANIDDFESLDLITTNIFESIDITKNSTSSDDYIDELIDGLPEEDFMDLF